MQLKIYLYSSQEEFNSLRSVQVIHQLVTVAVQPGDASSIYLARVALLFFCKVLQNQIIMVRYNVVELLEGLHNFPIETGETFDEQVRWIAIFAKESGQLALKTVANSLTINAINLLLKAQSITNRSTCLKAIAYLYMSGLCSENRYTPVEIQLITRQLSEALELKNEELIKSALKAAGSLLMQCHDFWGKKWPKLAETLVEQLIVAQNLRVDEFNSESMKQINNDAKLSLTLADECKTNINCRYC